jgi:hypothetical protein
VGNRATHNLIDNVPHVAIGFSGNEQTIEYNEIHSAVFQSNDAGAIYTSPPDETWTMRGHKIRYNYLHNIHGFLGKGCLGVYLDDCFSSADISNNIFYDVATAILIGGASVLLVVLRDTAVLGNTMSYFVLPSYETLRIATISEALSRVEILFAVVLIILFYTKVSLLYYVTVNTVAQITKAKSFHSLVLITGTVIVIYALTVFSSSTEHADWGQRTIPILWLFFEFLLPLVTLLVAALRRMPRPQAVNAS